MPKKIEIPSRQWQSLGVRTPQIISGFRGENTLDPFSIEKTFATRTKNLTGRGYPALSPRPGYSVLGSAFGGAITGLGAHKNSEIHAVGNGNWKRWTGSAWSSNLATGLSTTADWTFCNFEGNFGEINLIAANGVNTPRKWDGSSLSNLGNVPSGLNYICTHSNRVYGAVGYSLHFSALRKAEDWTTVDDAGELAVETDDGAPIIGLEAGFRHLMVFKERSFYELWGTNPGNYYLEPVAEDIGILSNKAVTTVQGAVYFVGQDSAYMYNGGRPRYDFSLPMREYFKNLNMAQKSKVVAGGNKKSLYVALPIGNATDPDTILEYDTEFQVWYIWKDYKPLHYAAAGDDFYVGDANGRVLKLGGTTDGGLAIQWEWVSVPFGGGSYAQRLQWYRMWYVVDIPSGSSMNVYLSPSAEGDSDWQLVKSITGGDLSSGRIIIPVDTVANANWVRVRFTGTGPAKITEFDYQQRELPMY